MLRQLRGLQTQLGHACVQVEGEGWSLGQALGWRGETFPKSSQVIKAKVEGGREARGGSSLPADLPK